VAPRNVVAIIQARMGSSRLPGKVLRHLGGKTVLAQVIERVKAGRGIDAVVVATTTNAADDPIEREALNKGATVFRGDENDVLRRYCHAARQSGADVVVRVTSDCPLIDPGVLSEMLRRFLEAEGRGNQIDYLSNTLERTFPRGLDVEIFTFSALQRADREAAEPSHREHVTPYIWNHPDLFSIVQYTDAADRSGLRWTLDTEEDWLFLSAVFRSLEEAGSAVTTAAVLQLLERHPELKEINAHVVQKGGGT
jgi:spore coat polysaccharide biosynthesis protein SpsF